MDLSKIDPIISLEPAVKVLAFIEIPRLSANKYEFDKERGLFFLDRTLYSPVHYPSDYGFLPNTLAEDGDPMDILVLSNSGTFPGCLVQARVIGALDMIDYNGKDTKILSVATGDPRFDEFEDVSDLQPHVTREIEHFFSIYKELEGKQNRIEGWRDRTYAAAELVQSRRRFLDSEKKKG